FLLVTMTVNGIGGFQRATLTVPIDFGEVALAIPDGRASAGAAVRALEDQGLPDLVRHAAEQALGEHAAALVPADAWRTAAEGAGVRTARQGLARGSVRGRRARGTAAGRARARRVGRVVDRLRSRLHDPLRRLRRPASRHLGRGQGVDADDAGAARPRLPD